MAISMPRPGHTTDFCFDSNGVFEVTSLAEMLTSNGKVMSSAKRRTVVKIWDVLRHTTQADFEKPFRVGPYSNTRNDGSRIYVTTYPDALDALHHDAFYGSDEDGRIEVSGYTDGLRQVLEPSQSEYQMKGSAVGKSSKDSTSASMGCTPTTCPDPRASWKSRTRPSVGPWLRAN